MTTLTLAPRGQVAGTPTTDLAVYIGRMQPLHAGHLFIIREALKQAKHLLILIGSPDRPREFRNPFTYAEREKMILDALHADEVGRVTVRPLKDHRYNDERWCGGVQMVVAAEAERLGAKTIKLAGHSKDNSSYYLKRFPQWGAIKLPNYRDISATSLREKFFDPAGAMQWLHSERDQQFPLLDPTTIDFLERFAQTEDYARVVAEYEHVRRYTKLWEKAPFPPTFVTVDAVVVQSGHLLLIRRGHMPGEGLWALPGGFINANETLVDSMIRELREETRIKMSAAVLRGSIKANRTFDDPHRSSRGRTITHAFLIHLPPSLKLPEVKAGSDANATKWVPLGSIKESELFEDHAAIVEALVSSLC